MLLKGLQLLFDHKIQLDVAEDKAVFEVHVSTREWAQF